MNIEIVLNANDRQIYEIEFRDWLPKKVFDSHVHAFAVYYHRGPASFCLYIRAVLQGACPLSTCLDGRNCLYTVLHRESAGHKIHDDTADILISYIDGCVSNVLRHGHLACPGC